MMVRPTKIHRPKTKRLSILVWFKPLTRQSPAQYTPNTSSAAQGAIHSRNWLREQRLTPRVMKSFSTILTTCGLLSGTRGAGDFAHPVLLGLVVDLGIGMQRF